jgi:hypothetical protein
MTGRLFGCINIRLPRFEFGVDLISKRFQHVSPARKTSRSSAWTDVISRHRGLSR